MEMSSNRSGVVVVDVVDVVIVDDVGLAANRVETLDTNNNNDYDDDDE